MAVTGCLGLLTLSLLLVCLSATQAAPDPMSYGGRHQEEVSQLALALSSDDLTAEEQAFDEEPGEEEIEEEAMFASETNEAFIKAIIAQINYLNELDKPVKKDCNEGEGFYKVQSSYYNNDRRWNFECRRVIQNNAPVTCTQTQSYVNDFNGAIVFSCGDNEYMAGVESYHDNSKGDRKWKFTCCSASNLKTSDCRLSDNANNLGKEMDFEAEDGEVITGVDSPSYNSKLRDRIWKFKVCKYKSSPPQLTFAPPLAVDDIYLRTFTLSVDRNRNLNLKTQDGLTATIPLQSPTTSQTSSNNILAYRPAFSDFHHSHLAGIFVNIEKIFPCIAKTKYVPICSIFTSEEDGFRKGKPFVELGDLGNNVKVFGKYTATYGLAVSGCSQLNSYCLPRWLTSTVVCLLPRSSCQN